LELRAKLVSFYDVTSGAQQINNKIATYQFVPNFLSYNLPGNLPGAAAPGIEFL